MPPVFDDSSDEEGAHQPETLCGQVLEKDGGVFGCKLPAGHQGPHQTISTSPTPGSAERTTRVTGTPSPPLSTKSPAAPAPAAAAASAVPVDDIAWRTEGHEWIGARTAHHFGKRIVLGTITKWVEADEAEGDPALWKARHDDGDEEDLEKHEVEEKLAAFAEGQRPTHDGTTEESTAAALEKLTAYVEKHGGSAELVAGWTVKISVRGQGTGVHGGRSDRSLRTRDPASRA